jgi:hypothetical protein
MGSAGAGPGWGGREAGIVWQPASLGTVIPFGLRVQVVVALELAWGRFCQRDVFQDFFGGEGNHLWWYILGQFLVVQCVIPPCI